MKHIFKILFVMLLVFTFSCDDDEENRFRSNPTEGWVNFTTPTDGTTITIVTESLELPVTVNVPIFEENLVVNYELVAVEGDFNDIVTTEGNSLSFESIPATSSGNPKVKPIKLSFANVDLLEETVVFEVVLTAVNKSGVTIGLNDESITRYRISTPCPLDRDAVAGTYSVAEVFTSGVNEGLSLAAAFGQSYQVELALDPTDPTQTIFILTNSIGFNQYFIDGTPVTYDTCNGTISFDGVVNLGDFSDMTIESSSFTTSPSVVQADGTLGNFGPYQFILTKQ
jgi:hypothetical protein